jgi:hypothetical protein
MTCEYNPEEGNLVITTRGGQEFIASTKMPLLDVFPLEDGLLLKCLYKPEYVSSTDNLHSYFTLTGHPLNDIYPLAMQHES